MSKDNGFIVALDQGTTSSRTIVYDIAGRECQSASRALPVRYPHEAWVEQDAEEIWETQIDSLREAIAGIDATRIRAIGITNQRETTIVWDRETGKPLGPAIVWQCRRSSEICARLREQGLEQKVKQKTGLVLDPYFSGSKIIWLLENVPGLKAKAEAGRAVFGTVDSWLIYNLSKDGGAQAFVTEASNASRTLLYSLNTADWDDELLGICGVARKNLASIKPSRGEFCRTNVCGVPVLISGVLGDQQASLYGHGGVHAGDAKCTFGTGAFLLVQSGATRVDSNSGLLTTAAWSEGAGGKSLSYALEGSVFMAGALIDWLRDGLGIISKAAETETLAASVSSSGGLVLVPAFVGLGSPYWDDTARGIIVGITRDTSSAHIVRACLEGIAHQVADITEGQDFKETKQLRIDGGMSKNKLFVQILADFTGLIIEVSPRAEVTAFGAAKIAALGAGCQEFGVANQAAGKCFKPTISVADREHARTRWAEAVTRSRGWASK